MPLYAIIRALDTLNVITWTVILALSIKSCKELRMIEFLLIVENGFNTQQANRVRLIINHLFTLSICIGVSMFFDLAYIISDIVLNSFKG